MPDCAVALCGNYSRKTKGKNISYHSFPQNADLRNIWITKCKRADTVNVRTARICSDHFSEEDYEDGSRAKFMNEACSKKLKENVFPHLNLPTTLADVSGKSQRSIRREKLQVKKECDSSGGKKEWN